MYTTGKAYGLYVIPFLEFHQDRGGSLNLKGYILATKMFPVRGRKLQKHVTNQNIEFVAYWRVRDFAMYKDQPFMLCNQASSFEKRAS